MKTMVLLTSVAAAVMIGMWQGPQVNGNDNMIGSARKPCTDELDSPDCDPSGHDPDCNGLNYVLEVDGSKKKTDRPLSRHANDVCVKWVGGVDQCGQVARNTVKTNDATCIKE